MYFGRFLDACESAYQSPQIQAGRDGRDGASLIEHADCRILAFRGTVTSGPLARLLVDWANDLHANLVEDERFPGRVHAGFLSSLTALWPAIVARAQATAGDKPLAVTGHSKGGALAFLAAFLLAPLRPLVVTFGAPRVGDHQFADAYKVPTYRFENPHDRVPDLPPWQYAPCGTAVQAPAWFRSGGLIESHELETGYRPWIV